MMYLLRNMPVRYSRVMSTRGFSSQSGLWVAKRRVQEEIHRPSLSGSSVGHLISEISAMKPGMESLRPEGETMSEEQRTFARKTVKWLMGLPLVMGVVIVGGNWMSGEGTGETEG